MLAKRVITALILIPLVILGIFFLPEAYFGLAVAVILSLAAWEWTRLAGLQIFWKRILYIGVLWWGFSVAQLLPNLVVLWIGFAWWILALYIVLRFPNLREYVTDKWLTRTVMGLFVFIPALQAIILLHKIAPIYVLFVLIIIWAADSGAYFIGRKYGDKKLAPDVSPNKTVAGLYGGVIVALIIAAVFGFVAHISFIKWLLWMIVVVATVFAAVLGDLFESVFKRMAGVKDSGSILPGHGGVLDRLDSLLAAVPIFALAFLMLVYT